MASRTRQAIASLFDSTLLHFADPELVNPFGSASEPLTQVQNEKPKPKDCIE
jgi:hypothetical protein